MTLSHPPLLQPPRQQKPIENGNPQPHQIRQRTDPMHTPKRPIQPLHLLRLRPRIIRLLPIPRLLMLPLLHDPRCDGARPEQIGRVECAHRRYGRQYRPPVLLLEEAGEA